MKFTYSTTEQDYVDGWWLRLKKTWRGIFFQSCNILALLGWLSAIGCTLYAHYASSTDAQWESVLLWRFNVVFFTVIFTLWALLFNIVTPYRVRRNYRKEPNVHAEFTTDLSPIVFSQTSSAGSNTTMQWSMFKKWRESKTVFIILLTKIQFVVIPKRSISEEQQTELRALLASVLPNK